jgi:hypothetical protein
VTDRSAAAAASMPRMSRVKDVGQITLRRKSGDLRAQGLQASIQTGDHR